MTQSASALSQRPVTVIGAGLGGLTAALALAHRDGEDVLDAARRTGPVHEFRRRRPTLAEIYRDAVADHVGAAATIKPTYAAFTDAGIV